MRLDVYLTETKSVRSRSRAKNLILMGFVNVDGKIIKKAAYEVNENNKVEITIDDFASLGAFKLKKALEEFDYEVAGKICMDIGASNGGFTETLLKNGAAKVYCVDVGECALPDYLKNDSRVAVKDKLNARFITQSDIPEKINLIVIDVSFISLRLIIPNMKQFLCDDGAIIALIKPQFEATKKQLNKKGIIKSDIEARNIVDKIAEFCALQGYKIKGQTPIPRLFEDKNPEWLIFMQIA